MKNCMKILSVGLITALSLGSMHAMRPAGGKKHVYKRGYIAPKNTRRPLAPAPVQTEEDKDFEFAFNLQAQEVQRLQEEETAAFERYNNLMRSEEFAMRLQDGLDDDDDSASVAFSDEIDGQQDLNNQLKRDEDFARRLQADMDAENVGPDQPAPLPTPNASSQGNVPAPVGNSANDVEEDDCTICSEAKANVWTLCCTKKDICKGCLDTWLRQNPACPFCREANPQILNAETMQKF